MKNNTDVVVYLRYLLNILSINRKANMKIAQFIIENRKMIIKMMSSLTIWCYFSSHMATKGENRKKCSYTIQPVQWDYNKIATLETGSAAQNMQNTCR